MGSQGTGELASGLYQPLLQAAKIITYKEPDNPEYSEFLKQLKRVALEQFNFTMEDGLVGGGPGTLQCDPLLVSNLSSQLSQHSRVFPSLPSVVPTS